MFKERYLLRLRKVSPVKRYVEPTSDRQRNPAGNLDIAFWSTLQRKAKLENSQFSQSVDLPMVADILLDLTSPNLIRPSMSRDAKYSGSYAAQLVLEAPLKIMGYHHRSCMDCEGEMWTSLDYDWEEALVFLSDNFRCDDLGVSYRHIESIAAYLSSRSDIFLDFLCALVQGYPKGHDFAFSGAYSLTTFRNNIEVTVNKRLAKSGFEWHLTDGIPMRVSSLTAGELGNPATSKDAKTYLERSEKYILEGEYAQSLTDSANALHVSLRKLGAKGNTLGDAVKDVKNRKLFPPAGSSLLDSVVGASHWVSALRNTKSSAHPAGKPTKDEAMLILRLSASVCAYVNPR